MISKSESTSLFVTKDIGECIVCYSQYKFNNIVYVIASQQDPYMQQLFEIMR